MLFRVWLDEKRVNCRTFSSISEAVECAMQKGLLVTQDVPLGDPVMILVEDLAYGTPEFEVPEEIKTAALEAIRERSKFDLHKGR